MDLYLEMQLDKADLNKMGYQIGSFFARNETKGGMKRVCGKDVEEAFKFKWNRQRKGQDKVILSISEMEAWPK